MPQRDRIMLNAWLNTGGSHPDSWNRGGGRDRIFTLEHYVAAAEVARRGILDAVFLADQAQLSPSLSTRPEYPVDPIVLLSAVTARVPDIGAIATASTSFSLPYTLARQIASANLLSGGRVGWNAVATFRDIVAANYGSSIASHHDRYRKADEFVGLVIDLWNSWRYDWGDSDPAKHPFGSAESIDHAGEFFTVAGPLNVPLPATGPPVIAQAGGSDQGIDLAGKYGEVIYANLRAREASRRYVARVRASARSHGRQPGDVLVIPSITPLIGSTDAEVRRLVEEHSASSGGIEQRIIALERTLGVSLLTRDWDEPLAGADLASDVDTGWPVGVKQAIIDQAVEEGLTLRQLAAAEAGIAPGTPEQIADRLVDWWRHDAADGFTITPLVSPIDLELFVDQVVPILQSRGLARRSYEEGDLRTRLRLSAHGPSSATHARTHSRAAVRQ